MQNQASLQETKQHGAVRFPFNLYPCAIPGDFPQVALHWQESMELVFVKRGMGLVQVGAVTCPARMGDIFIFTPGTLHALRQAEGQCMEYENIIFALELLGGAEDLCAEKYLLPLQSGRLSLQARLTPNDLCYLPAAACLREVEEANRAKLPGYELLGKWVSRQRYAWQNPDRSSARLTPERKALLDQLGMVWQKPDSWQHRYELAAAYKAAHGSLELPAQYRTEEGIWLGSWLSRQKQLLQKGDKSLRGERVKALKELFRGEPERRSGAVRTRARCSVRERNWLNNYRHAKAYAKRRGDLLVPASYVDETGFRLGVWISNLRAARKTRPDSFQVTPEHIGMLDEIGMQWDAREAKWQCALRRAGEYRAAHGDLAVPVNYKTEDGFCLGDWIRRMRESYAAHDARLTPERVENLSALGMVWAPAEG